MIRKQTRFFSFYKTQAPCSISLLIFHAMISSVQFLPLLKKASLDLIYKLPCQHFLVQLIERGGVEEVLENTFF